IGLIFIFGIYTLGGLWPSGWAWGQGHSHHLMMIARSLAQEWDVRRSPGMRFLVRSSIVLVVFWFDAAAAQEGYFGHDHDKWQRSFYKMLLRPDTKTPCCNLTDCRPASLKFCA